MARPTNLEAHDFAIQINYGHEQHALDLGRKLAIKGDRNLADDKARFHLLTICKDGILAYFERWDTDTTDLLTLIEIENIIEHFNRISGNNYYIKLI